ncbi:MAG: aldehyde dehydrogenase family protein [Gammaproteobacteria bacterium]|nr:aldehyde dehydrogenase family protein [Gammaproteobacteria bacterium]
MANTISITSPIDGSIVAERPMATEKDIAEALQAAKIVQHSWQNTSISDRAAFCHQAIDHLLAHSDDISREITLQMGRPIKYSPGELRGLEERGRYMIDIAEQELSDIPVSSNHLHRFIRRTPLGTVLTIAPWNYPYLTAVNTIIPALMAGNTVLLKHSMQTLLCAERFQQAFDYAGLAKGVFQSLFVDHAGTAALVKSDEVDFISFTGSVTGGIKIERTAAGLFKGVALELGGKDPAYVREDANIDHAVENIVDGAYFNSGQSCCGIERVYVHQSQYEHFVEQFITLVKQYKLGNPLEADTTLGPMINTNAADRVRDQINKACAAGAKACIDTSTFPQAKNNSPYLAPQVLIDVSHDMAVMQEESFGPVVGIMSVSDDQQAIEFMNDSRYGLTASIWTADMDTATAIGDEINTGTVFMNRCDYLDPALAWVGTKDSGRGCSLSVLGYAQLTRPKSFHLKTI